MEKKSWKYYIGTFFMVLAFVLIMMIIAHIQKTYLVSSSVTSKGVWAKTFHIFLYKDFEVVLGNYLLDMLALIGFPVLFTGLFVAIDKITAALKPKKKKLAEEEQLAYEAFVDSLGAKLNKVSEFNVEDFRHFRINSKFQECLKRLYEIYKNGESENINYQILSRKFNKGTKEKAALDLLMGYTKEKREEKLENEALEKEKSESLEKQKSKSSKGGK